MVVDTVLAFWDGYSSGTKFTIDYALQINKKVLFIDFSHPIVRSDIIGEPLDRKEAESKYLSSNNQNSISIERFRVFKEMAKSIDLINERYAFSYNAAKTMFNPSEYSVLKNKDNVYLAMPSTTNFFPLALANLLKENFGGTVIENFAKQLHESGIKKLTGTDKIFADRSFQITEEFKKSIDSIQSKNIVIVDDIISTGFTLDVIRKLLQDLNINCNYIASIVNTSTSLSTDNSIYSLAQKISTSPEEKIDYHKKLKSVFYNTPSAAMMHAHQCLRTPEDTGRFKQKVNEKYISYAIEGIQEYSYKFKQLKDICFSIYSKHNIRLPPTLTNLIEKVFAKDTISSGLITDTINFSISKHRNLNYTWSSNHLPENFVNLYSCKDHKACMYYIKSFKEHFAACQIYNSKSHTLLGTGKSVEYLQRKIEHHSLLVQIKSDLQNSLTKVHCFQQSLDF